MKANERTLLGLFINSQHTCKIFTVLTLCVICECRYQQKIHNLIAEYLNHRMTLSLLGIFELKQVKNGAIWMLALVTPICHLNGFYVSKKLCQNSLCKQSSYRFITLTEVSFTKKFWLLCKHYVTKSCHVGQLAMNNFARLAMFEVCTFSSSFDYVIHCSINY